MVIGLISLILIGGVHRQWIWNDYRFILILFAISLLALTSATWSITPDKSLSRALKITAIFLLAFPVYNAIQTLPAKHIHRIKSFFPFPLIILAVFLLIEIYGGMPVTHMVNALPMEERTQLYTLNKYCSILSYLFPLGIVFAIQSKQLSIALLLTILTACVLYKTELQAAQLAFGVGLLAPVILFIIPRNAIPLTILTCGFLVAFMPFLSPIAFDALASLADDKSSILHKASISMRLENYDFISRKIMTNPLTGFGIDSTRSIEFESGQQFYKGTSILHPHNMALQIWIEFGLAGVLVAWAGLLHLNDRLLRKTGKPRYMAYTLLCCSLVFLMISWSIWSSWLLGLILFTSALLPLVEEQKPDRLTS